ncbi:YceI family protein [Actinacidiphila oryziradicis]|uniref:YceI family protein n=1 Tax=Actinacidiphila oryziradicis TaxID=2571141 RepID=UPI0023F42E52|nr:YceI family protein [Actinacidiphila oryziradicis]
MAGSLLLSLQKSCPVEVVVEAASFKTGNQQRDDHVRSSDYLDVARHPEIGFRSRLLERPGAGATLQGELTACGVSGGCGSGTRRRPPWCRPGRPPAAPSNRRRCAGAGRRRRARWRAPPPR